MHCIFFGCPYQFYRIKFSWILFYKWNDFEVLKIALFDDDFLESISKNPTIGQYNNDKNIFSIVISKQTT